MRERKGERKKGRTKWREGEREREAGRQVGRQTDIQIRRKKSFNYLYLQESIIIYTENLNKLTNKLQKLISEFRKVQEYKSQKSIISI